MALLSNKPIDLTSDKRRPDVQGKNSVAEAEQSTIIAVQSAFFKGNMEKAILERSRSRILTTFLMGRGSNKPGFPADTVKKHDPAAVAKPMAKSYDCQAVFGQSQSGCDG